MKKKTRILTSRFDEALGFAARLHATQKRKGTDIPYVAHLLALTSLVITHGGNEDEAIAALLHDAVEDQGGQPTLEVIRARFGEKWPQLSTTALIPTWSLSHPGENAKSVILRICDWLHPL